MRISLVILNIFHNYHDALVVLRDGILYSMDRATYNMAIIIQQDATEYSLFILVIKQIDAQNLFYNKFIPCLYMFRAPCAHRQEVKNCTIQSLVSSHL